MIHIPYAIKLDDPDPAKFRYGVCHGRFPKRWKCYFVTTLSSLTSTFNREPIEFSNHSIDAGSIFLVGGRLSEFAVEGNPTLDGFRTWTSDEFEIVLEFRNVRSLCFPNGIPLGDVVHRLYSYAEDRASGGFAALFQPAEFPIEVDQPLLVARRSSL